MNDTEFDTQAETSQETSSAGTVRPIATFRGSGGLSVAVWKNRSSAEIDNYSIRIERSYKDGKEGDDKFSYTQSLRDIDLLRVQKLLNEADNWIEQDKAKFRARSSGQAIG